MKRKALMLSALVSFLSLSASFTLAADQDRIQDRLQTQDQEQIYGSQLMTQQERAEYHAKMRTAKNAMEQEQIRKEHHERMQERAKNQGVTLPNEPPVKGSSMGSGSGGMGTGSGGMGTGSGGRGSGGGRGR